METLYFGIILLVSVLQVLGLPKGGKCPVVEPTVGGDCAEHCYTDVDCPNIQLCCSNGCGHACIKPECDTTKEGFSQKEPVEMLANGKCPSGSRTQSFINGQRLCCQYDWSMSQEAACPVEFTEPLVSDGCSMMSGNCPMGWSCAHHAADAWHVCCRNEAPPTCKDSDKQCEAGEVCVLEEVQCATTPCDDMPKCEACDRVCPANLICPYGQKKDDIGCDLCECNPTPFYCEGITCGDGEICRRVDNTGIQCDCFNDGPCECPNTFESRCVPLNPECGDNPLVCDDRCEHGYLPRGEGCPYCLHCNPDPYPSDGCPVLSCSPSCEQGKAISLDENGCPTCQCYEPSVQCPMIDCAAACEEPTPKYDYLEDGCRGCDCVSNVVCPQLMCQCPDGYKHDTDMNGCETCDCIPIDVCGPVCTMYCEHGMVRDSHGCPICQCWEPHPCENMDCSDRSEYWCKTVMVEMTATEMRPEARCLPVFPDPDCGDLACFLECEHGYLYDERGCSMCKCDPFGYPPFSSCNLPKAVVGDCDAAFTKWTYDSENDQCQEFTYGGCGGNDNRFDTEEECEDECSVGDALALRSGSWTLILLVLCALYFGQR